MKHLLTNENNKITSNKFYSVARFNGLTIQVGFRPDKFQGIAAPGQNDPDILGSEQVVNKPGTGCK